MKVGVRKPSLKKSIKARTTGKAKRAIKKATIPGYGQKGIGYINDPNKAVYNKVYNKTTIDARDVFNSSSNNGNNINTNTSSAGILDILLALIQMIVALVQVIIYGGALILMIWFIVSIF